MGELHLTPAGPMTYQHLLLECACGYLLDPGYLRVANHLSASPTRVHVAIYWILATLELQCCFRQQSVTDRIMSILLPPVL